MVRHAEVGSGLDCLRNSRPTEIHLPADFQCSPSPSVCNGSCYFPLQHFSFLHLGLFLSCSTPFFFLIPRLDSTVFSKCLVDRLGECDSAAETTAHLLSFSYPLLISLSLFYCRSNSFISVLTEAHFRWSVLLRHIPFSSARMRFFFSTYPTRPSHPQIYCQCGG